MNEILTTAIGVIVGVLGLFCIFAAVSYAKAALVRRRDGA